MMWPAFCLAILLAIASGQVPQETKDAIEARLDDIEATMNQLTRQLILQRLAFEESLRSDGDSGVKQIRVGRDGTRPYYSSSHVGHSAVAIHDHTETNNHAGMGEFEAVLNGVHFRTRHNDYQLVMPHPTSGDYHSTVRVPYPDVPPAVLNKTDLNEQFREMRSWFRAWLDGDDSERNYHDYFKPMLCYLEGAWTNDVNIDEPFDSERHHLDASSWFDLQEKVRFTAATGDKDQAENFAYLPTKVVNVTDGHPIIAQWNYRILCHPIKDNLLEVKHLKPVDDVHSRFATGGRSLTDWMKTRAARFSVNEFDKDVRYFGGNSLLDRLMQQIPGKDNYQGNIVDDALATLKKDVHTGEVLNAAYYHRWYKRDQNDAMGVQVNHRGFPDSNMWVAQTTQSRVVPFSLEVCQNDQCTVETQRVTFAIPLEIIWLTPLNTWNPFDIEYKGNHWTDLGKTVVADGRNGGFSPTTAFNGTNSNHYLFTPAQYFTGVEVGTDPADTVPGTVGVLDQSGIVRSVMASGIRIFLPETVDVGTVRTRYPICPIYAEGNAMYKEMDALSKILMDLTGNTKYLHKVPNFGSNETQGPVKPDPDRTFFKLQTAPSVSSDPNRGSHIHYVDLQTAFALRAIDGCETYRVRTTLSKFHTHLLTIKYNHTTEQFEYTDCDGREICRDNHGVVLTPLPLQ